MLWIINLSKWFRYPIDYWNIEKGYSVIINAFALYGVVIKSNQNEYFIFSFICICSINFIFNKILSNKINFRELYVNKKRVLFHEIGHFVLAKELDILNPKFISLETQKYSMGHISLDGEIETIDSDKVIMFLLSGYITEEYILDDKVIFKTEDLKIFLLKEFINLSFNLDYSNKIISIYLDSNKLQKITREVISIIDKNIESIYMIAEENKYKKTIILDKYREEKN